ncbi:MAG: carboxymuconolactone decarboxylase family protein [Bacteroidota bacterium]|nr:carboxymuconolactone decarboxylase family protein [Candidatus Kapabacteria bacterium]MDW8219980.1 carboxymuconolactone decarboxylase family protein [Bacteroidota bacterium]
MRHEEYIHHLVEQSEVLLPSEQSLILAASASALHEHDLLKGICTVAFSHSTKPEELYESLLQTYLFAGFPAALEGLTVFKAVCEHACVEFTPPSMHAIDIPLFQERGRMLCEQIYTTAYEKMRRHLHSVSPDLDAWMIIEGYGKTLSRPVLASRMRELVVVGVLAVLGWDRQLYSHLRGAMNLGATPGECIDTLKILRLFVDCGAETLQALLAQRLTIAQETLHRLLSASSLL